MHWNTIFFTHRTSSSILDTIFSYDIRLMWFKLHMKDALNIYKLSWNTNFPISSLKGRKQIWKFEYKYWISSGCYSKPTVGIFAITSSYENIFSWFKCPRIANLNTYEFMWNNIFQIRNLNGPKQTCKFKQKNWILDFSVQRVENFSTSLGFTKIIF